MGANARRRSILKIGATDVRLIAQVAVRPQDIAEMANLSAETISNCRIFYESEQVYCRAAKPT